MMTRGSIPRWRKWTAAWPLALLIPAAGIAAQKAGPLALTDVRFWSLGDATRIAIEVSGEFEYRWDRLKDPDRIYFDILGARPRLGNERVHIIPVNDRLVKQIRVAQTQPEVARVVFDLTGPADFKAAQLANPNRLMVEIQPAPPDAAATAAAPSEQQASEVRIPTPAKRNNSGNRSLVRALGLKLGRVVIDPGHGGHDTGTIGRSGEMEKDLVLDVARKLGILIEERLGAEVIYTRTDDSFVRLEDRTALANEKKADLFLSIHVNAGARTAAGPETYYLDFTTSRSALDVAARENASSEKSIHELQELIQKIAFRDKVEESREFAENIQTAMHSSLERAVGAPKDRGVRKAPFLVLVGASMPSVLAEIGFLSNTREERLLKQAKHRQRIAEALFKGVSEYASTLSHFQVAERKSPKD